MWNPNNSDQADVICLLSQLVWGLAKNIEQILASTLNPKVVTIAWPQVSVSWQTLDGGDGDVVQRSRICALAVQSGQAAGKGVSQVHMSFDMGFAGNFVFCCVFLKLYFIVCCCC